MLVDVTFYVIIETNDELNPLAREMMQNDMNTVYAYMQYFV
jgi:uncharacterized protein YaaR (DUF327 family)